MEQEHVAVTIAIDPQWAVEPWRKREPWFGCACGAVVQSYGDWTSHLRNVRRNPAPSPEDPLGEERQWQEDARRRFGGGG